MKIGETVWYWPEGSECGPYPKGNPLHAWIAGINEDGSVNLGVLTVEGKLVGIQNIPFVEEGADKPVLSKGSLARHAEYAHDLPEPEDAPDAAKPKTKKGFFGKSKKD